ncbi:uncharacterized protein LOC111355227 [Spodoptera litura]|uniref:Uncharacterized protein LOC111355227 n=1 Tax=Spodoptera litura TaxID=69820 RepID=A0A9J7E5C9_SPOLT|nr:uncharacterized protein LOC111355227 [Spodoptera litura]
MHISSVALVLAMIVVSECGHTFLGTSVQRPLVFHKEVRYPARGFQKRIENVNFTLPHVSDIYLRNIQGILAYDLTNSGASANVTKGGLGYNFVNIRLKSDRNKEIRYDINIYA